MRLEFSWQNCRRVFDEPNFADLVRGQQDEMAPDTLPVALDEAKLLRLEEAGVFRAWAAYEGETLVGYVGWSILSHFLFGEKRAIDEGYFLVPRCRRGGNGIRMFREAFAALGSLGVTRALLHEKVDYQHERGGVGVIFRRLGCIHSDNIWFKDL